MFSRLARSGAVAGLLPAALLLFPVGAAAGGGADLVPGQDADAPSEAARQAASGATAPGDPIPIARAFLDEDGDFAPDRLGDTVTVAGRALVGTGPLHTARFVVYIDDGTGAVLLFGDEHGGEPRQPVAAGDRVIARGVVTQYAGQDELDVLSYRVEEGASGPAPEPVRLAAPDSATLEAHEGKLVTVEGVVVSRGANEGGQFAWIYPDGAERRIQVFAANWRGTPVDLTSLEYGDRVVATGLLGQYDTADPRVDWYQLYPRSASDLHAPAVALGLTRDQLLGAGGGAAALLLVGLLSWGWRQRQRREEARRRYRMLFDQNLAGVFHTTADGEIVECNPAWAEMYGFGSPDEARERRAWDMYGELSDREVYLRTLREEGEVRDYEHRHRRVDGEEIRVLESSRLLEDDAGREHIVGTVIDLTDRLEAERDHQAAEERYRLLFERNVAGAFRSTLDGTLLEVNRAFAEMLGHEGPEDLVGQPARDLYADPGRRDELMERLEAEGRIGNEEIALERRDGSTVWVLENSFKAEDPATGQTVNIGTVTEITEQVEAERAMEELAHRDPLTELPNRRQLEESVPRLLQRAGRREERVAVVYIDLNGFKEVNDRWGHAAGDEVLRRVADRLRSCVREEDLAARIGGDEFLVVLPGQASREAARGAAARGAERCFRRPLELEGRQLSLSASMGVAIFPDDAEDFHQLVNHADRAMYRASREGSLVEFYDQTEDQPYGGRLERRERIERAIEESQIRGWRQPIYELAGDRRLDWIELLARWEQPDGPVLAGADLIPEIQSLGLVTRLDLAMLRQAAAEAADWREGTVASNLAAKTLASGELVDAVRGLLEEHPGAEGRLAVEVTEHAALREPERTREVLEELTDLGVAVALDDFGSGYSSLAHLEKLPVHTVKLDFSLIQQIGRGGRAEALVSGAIDLAHSLDARVVAEGVEREDQLRWLLRSECDAVQGFLMGRPVPPGEELPSTLARGRAAARPVAADAPGEAAS